MTRILDARGASRLALSPDGTTLYYVSDLTGTIQLWSVPAAGGAPVRLSYESDRVGAYRVSPNGTHVAYGADEGGDERWVVWVMRADGSEARPLTNRRDRIHHVVDWTPDSRAVLAFANLRDERYFDLHEIPLDGSTPRLLFRHDGTGFRATALPDGRVLWDFSDTFLGLVRRDGSRPSGQPFINNSMIVEDGGALVQTLHGGTPESPTSLIIPADQHSWYWVGDMTDEGDRLRVFVMEFTRTGGGCVRRRCPGPLRPRAR